MCNKEQEALWKAESEQLKADLAARKKVVKRNEVEIRFPKKKPSFSDKKPVINSTEELDSFFRQQIDFVDPDA